MDELLSISDMLLASVSEKMSASPSIFNLWFNEFKLASLTEEEVIFTTPSAIKKNILSTKYQKLISDSLEETIGFVPLKISIVTEEEFKSPNPKGVGNTASVISAPYFETNDKKKNDDDDVEE